MTAPDPSRWLVLVNPRAGRRRRLFEEVREALLAAGVAADIEIPEGVDAMRARVRGAMERGRARIAVVGGDGTLNLAADEVMRSGPETAEERPILGILPAGTGSDFARTFAIPQDLRGAAARLAGGQTYTIDVGRIEGSWGARWFVNVGEAGATGATVARAERLPSWLGPLKYHLAFALTFPTFPKARVVIEGRRRIEAEALLVVFANAQFFGGGWNIAPRATLVDGVLDVQVFSATKREVPALWRRAKTGDHLRAPQVRRVSLDRFMLTADPPWPVEADGEYLGETPVEVSVAPAALRVAI